MFFYNKIIGSKIVILFRSIAGILFLTLCIMIFLIIQLYNTSTILINLKHDRFVMTAKADEVINTSNDLTNFARLYVSTGDSQYKKNYWKIWDVRNGKILPEKGYMVYWDLLENHLLEKDTDNKPVSLKDVHKLPYTKYEFERLDESERNLEYLMKIEQEAFNAIEGLFKDSDGNYTVKKEPDETFARELLNSKNYYSAKEKIIVILSDFIESLAQRTEADISKYKYKRTLLFQCLFIVTAVNFIIIILMLNLINKKVLKPVKYLMKVISSFQKDEKSIPEKKIFYNDEIGLLTEHLFEMKKQIDIEYQKVKDLSIHDYLTGAYNRRYSFEFGEKLLDLHRRSNKKLSVLIIDIDFFKKINDTYGHAIGDEVLKQVVEKIKHTVRKTDVLARFGGEEFIVLLPETIAKSACIVAEKICTTIQNEPYKKDSVNIIYTISAGVAEYREGDSLYSLIDRADKAMYKAKENGRNQVYFSE